MSRKVGLPAHNRLLVSPERSVDSRTFDKRVGEQRNCANSTCTALRDERADCLASKFIDRLGGLPQTGGLTEKWLTSFVKLYGNQHNASVKVALLRQLESIAPYHSRRGLAMACMSGESKHCDEALRVFVEQFVDVLKVKQHQRLQQQLHMHLEDYLRASDRETRDGVYIGIIDLSITSTTLMEGRASDELLSALGSPDSTRTEVLFAWVESTVPGGLGRAVSQWLTKPAASTPAAYQEWVIAAQHQAALAGPGLLSSAIRAHVRQVLLSADAAVFLPPATSPIETQPLPSLDHRKE